MSRVFADTLDLSRLSAPLAIRGLDHEKIIAERGARLVVLMNEFGIAFDVEQLKTDPSMIVERADSFRELLKLAETNDTVRAVMIAFATGSDLDHLGLTAALNLPFSLRDTMLRRTIVPATGSTPAIMESDAEYRRRLLLSPEAYSTAGAPGAYHFHALSAHPLVLNTDVWTPVPGEVIVALQSREGNGEASEILIEAVRRRLHERSVKPLTDVVSVRSIETFEYAIQVECFVLPGPDPVTVKESVEASLAKMAAARRTPSRDIPRSAVNAAAHIEPVDRVVVALPAADVAMGYGEVGVCTGINVTVTAHDG